MAAEPEVLVRSCCTGHVLLRLEPPQTVSSVISQVHSQLHVTVASHRAQGLELPKGAFLDGFSRLIAALVV